MNKKTLKENNGILLLMVNSIRGITNITEEEQLNKASLKLFLHEVKNNKDVITRNSIETEDIKNMNSMLAQDNDLLTERADELRLKLYEANEEIRELQKIEVQYEQSYDEAEIKHKVKLHKEEEEFYKQRYVDLEEDYRELFSSFNELVTSRSSDDVKEMAITFAKHATPKLIIPEMETSDNN